MDTNNALDEGTIERYLNHTREFQSWIESLISERPRRVGGSSAETVETKTES